MTVEGAAARRPAALVAVAAIAAAGLSACDSGSAQSTSGSTITFGSHAPLIGGFDPSVAQGDQGSYLDPIYDTLLRRSSDGTLTPGLATSWSYASATQLVLHLRHGVKFSDGETFDAAAVVANLKRTAASGGNQSSHLSAISTISATNAATVSITLSRPQTSLLSTLADIPGMMAAPKAFANLKTHPVGTGPWIYQPSKSSAGASYSYAPNGDYWDAAHRVSSSLTIKTVSDYSTALNGVRSGQLDIAVVRSTQAVAAKPAGLTVTSKPNARLAMVLIDRDGKQVPALGKTAVRQAMSYAIDRTGIAKTLTDGFGVPSPGFWYPGYWPADPAMRNAYPHDVAKAKSLLAQAGYAHGFTVQVATLAQFQPYAEAVQAQLKTVGISVRVHILQDGVLARTMTAGTYPIVLTPVSGGGTTADPGSDVQQFLMPNSPYNPQHHTDAEIVSLAQQGESLTSRSQRQPIYRRIDMLATTQAVDLILGYLPNFVVSRRNVHGLTFIPCGGGICTSFDDVRKS